MRVGYQIEKTRQELGLPLWYMCNILDITSEQEYHDIITGRTKLTAYQQIMFIAMIGVH